MGTSTKTDRVEPLPCTPRTSLNAPLPMAFAQFYYDPAVEFEKLLDDHGAAAGLPVPTPVPQTGDVAAQPTAPVADKVVYVAIASWPRLL